MAAKVVALGISHHPDGKIGIHIIEPRFECIRVCCVAKHPGRGNRASGRIMPAIDTVRIRHTACSASVPGKIGPVLPERPAKTDIRRWILSRIGTGIKIMQSAWMRVGHGIVAGEKHMFGIG